MQEAMISGTPGISEMALGVTIWLNQMSDQYTKGSWEKNSVDKLLETEFDSVSTYLKL